MGTGGEIAGGARGGCGGGRRPAGGRLAGRGFVGGPWLLRRLQDCGLRAVVHHGQCGRRVAPGRGAVTPPPADDILRGLDGIGGSPLIDLRGCRGVSPHTPPSFNRPTADAETTRTKKAPACGAGGIMGAILARPRRPRQGSSWRDTPNVDAYIRFEEWRPQLGRHEDLLNQHPWSVCLIYIKPRSVAGGGRLVTDAG